MELFRVNSVSWLSKWETVSAKNTTRTCC